MNLSVFLLFSLLSIPYAIVSGFRPSQIVTSPRSKTWYKMSNDDETMGNYVLRYRDVLEKNTYSKLVDKISNHDVSKIYVSSSLDAVVSENTKRSGDIQDDYTITTINPFIVNAILDTSRANNVKAVILQPNVVSNTAKGIVGLLENNILSIIIFTFIFSIIRNVARNMGGSMNPMGMGQKEVNVDKDILLRTNITLKSFGGSEEIFEECTEVVSYLKNETMYKEAGAEIPRGILLEGPPGTGKTLLAKAIASEAESNFISATASEFVELFVGMGASKIRTLFKTARDNRPCIIFIDEIDSVGRQRGANMNQANDEREQTLNQLLAEMDGFADNEGILVIAATNRKDILDNALLRPGRFDRIITVPLPDSKSRIAIFNVHSKNKRLNPEIDINLVADLTNGFSGAQIKNLLNEAAIFAARRGDTIIQSSDLFNALDKLLIGIIKRNDTRSVDSRLRVAIHETGHALMAAHFKEYFELKKVSIQSTYSGAGGYTVFNEYQNITESGLYTKDMLFKRLIIGLGGKAAENIFYGENHVSVGSTLDLQQSTTLAHRMIEKYGMGNKLESLYIEKNMPNLISEDTKMNIDTETLALLNSAFSYAKEWLSTNNEIVNTVVHRLMETNILYGNEVYDLVE